MVIFTVMCSLHAKFFAICRYSIFRELEDCASPTPTNLIMVSVLEVKNLWLML